MRLVIGLGNPGKEYENTRHNAGFMAVDYWREKMGWEDFKEEKKFFSLISEGKIGREKIILAKPITYMNDSGVAVRTLMNFYKIKPEKIIVLQDDKDVVIGKIKTQNNRGDAGHNGIKSLQKHIGTNNFTRIRIGIRSADEEKIEVISHFVLNNFNKEEKQILKNTFSKITAELEKIIKT